MWVPLLVVLLIPLLAVSQPLSGDKVIKASGGDYATLAAAIADINSKGVSGTLRLLIDENLTEIGSPEITSTSLTGNNNLIIKPAAGKTPTVTFTACATTGTKSNTGLAISGTGTNVGNITIDGSNTVGGTTRDMTFALNDGTAGRYGFRLNGQTDTVTIKNLRILAQAVMATTSSGTRTYGINCLATAAGAADALTVTNCQIGTATAAFYYSLYKPDGGTVPYGLDLNVLNNEIYAQHKGLSVWGADGVSAISGNTITMIGHPTGVYVQNSINGIYAESWKGTLNITGNKVVKVRARAVSQAALRHLYGILLYYAIGSGITGQTANITNNFVSNFIYSGDASVANSEIIGIAVDALDQTVNVYHNTVYVNNDSIATNPVAGIRVYDDLGQSAYVKNNIVVNTVNHDSSYAIYVSPIVNSVLKASNYNDLVVTGANAYTGYYNGAKHKTLANWQTASSQDANSIAVNPADPFGASGMLKSLTDLHWFSAPAASFNGTPIAGVTTDIDGDARSATVPTMGADEYKASTSVEFDPTVVPRTVVLDQNYPNPFNPTTNVRYAIPQSGHVTLTVVDMLGRNVATLFDGVRSAGSYAATWDASSLPSGVYFCRLAFDGTVSIRSMQLVK
jgi:hypothetical protein